MSGTTFDASNRAGDAPYLQWLHDHRARRVLNTRRRHDPTYMVVHKATCRCRTWPERRVPSPCPPSNFVLRIVVEEDAKLVRTLNARYADATPDGGLDTVERDALLDVVAKHFIERLWPRSGGMDATRPFMADLQRAMILLGAPADYVQR